MKQLKRRLVTLMLAAALCLGLAVPALAVDASGLDAATAKTYADILSAQISQYGIVSTDFGNGIQYADLVDMDADGIPELILIRYQDNQYTPGPVNIGIWTMKNGSAVRTVDEDIEAGNVWAEISFARKGNQIRLYYAGMNVRQGLAWDWAGLISADGTIEEDHQSMVAGNDGWDSVLKIDTTWQPDQTPIVYQNGPWGYDESQASAVRMLQSSLKSQAVQAASTNTPTTNTTTADGYTSITISGDDGYNDPFFITFEAAKMEQQTITLCYDEPNFDENIDVYELHTVQKPQVVNMIVVKPQSSITVIGGAYMKSFGSTASAYHYTFDGEVYHSDAYSFEADYIYTQNITDFMRVNANDISANSRIFLIVNTDYFFRLGTSDTQTSNTTTVTTGFTDVSSTAYYASAVTWAVGKGITNGTGTNKFSPENTCNNAEILTFIWRAKGQPEPAVSNPFSNVKSSDYYYKAALWAYQNGLVTGSSFNTSAPCTRSMAVTYLWKAAGSPAAGASGFSDVPASASYAQAVAWAVNQGITNGDGANTFSPDKTCTRGQIVTFLYRAFA